MREQSSRRKSNTTIIATSAITLVLLLGIVAPTNAMAFQQGTLELDAQIAKISYNLDGAGHEESEDTDNVRYNDKSRGA